MYLAKIILSFGTLLISGSLLFMPIVAWGAVVVARSIAKEERYLSRAMPGYSDYQTNSKLLVLVIRHLAG